MSSFLSFCLFCHSSCSLRLAACLISEKGCIHLASVVFHTKIRELDLQNNYPGDAGLKQLKARQTDPLCNLDLLKCVLFGIFTDTYTYTVQYIVLVCSCLNWLTSTYIPNNFLSYLSCNSVSNCAEHWLKPGSQKCK